MHTANNSCLVKDLLTQVNDPDSIPFHFFTFTNLVIVTEVCHLRRTTFTLFGYFRAEHKRVSNFCYSICITGFGY